jgi:hypothetical protein
VHAAERAGDRLERGGYRGILRRLRLQLCEGRLEMAKRRLAARSNLRSPRALDLVKGAHGLSDRGRQLE